MMRRALSTQKDFDVPKGNILSLKDLSKYLLPYKTMIIFMLIMLFITSSSVLAIGRMLQYVIDHGISKNNPAMLDHALIYLFGLVIVLALATSARYFLITIVGEKVISDIRKDIYDHLLTMSPSFFESYKPGEILSRMNTDTLILQSIIGSSISVALRNIIMLIGGIVMLVLSSSKLAFMMAFVIPLVVLPVMYFGKQVRIYSRISQDKIAELNSLCEETISGIKIIQSYVKENQERIFFNKKLLETVNAAISRVKSRALVIGLVISLVFGAISLVLWVGGHDVLEGNITSGELSAFIFTSVICAGAVGALVDVVGDIQKAAGATERLIEFLNTKSDIQNSKDSISLIKNLSGNIKFENVTFFYPSRPNKPSINNISFEVVPDSITAIVGESGAGKTTIFQLLLRFYDIQSGKISFDDQDIKYINLQSLRKNFAYVTQDPVIFSNTAYDNISYGHDSLAIKEDVINAAKSAAALDFIEKLPNGFNTYLGEKGVRISGGQKQRIAIARAILKDAPILLLDEATSSLDAKNERDVQDSLEKLMHGRTTIVIAHRLSTVINADKILVFKNGQIVETGNHDELMRLDGEYTKLVKLQLS